MTPLALLPALMLLASPARSSEEPKPTRAVWAYPLPAAFFGITLDERALFVPLGLTWPIAGKVDLVSEATFTHGLPTPCGPAGVAVWGAMGPSFRGEDGGPLNGGFFQPKLIVRHQVGAAPRCRSDNQEDFASESELSAGFDFGLQRTYGRLYLALVFGVHFGYCVNCPARSAISFGPLSNDYPRGNRFKTGFNMNFIRMGYTF